MLQNQWLKQHEQGVPSNERKLGPGQCGWVEGASIVSTGVLSNPLIEPVQLHLRSGDAVILHYQLLHCVSENISDGIRMNLYHRVKHSQLDADIIGHEMKSLLNMWDDFDSIDDTSDRFA